MLVPIICAMLFGFAVTMIVYYVRTQKTRTAAYGYMLFALSMVLYIVFYTPKI